MLSFTQPICSYLAAIQRRINSPVSSAIGSFSKIQEIGSLGGKLKAACAINEGGAITGYCEDGMTRPNFRQSPRRDVTTDDHPFAPGNRSYDDRSPLPSNNVLTQKV
jgi:hypothetical protein